MKLLDNALESIKPLNEEAMKAARRRLDNLTKPIGSMGMIEEIAEKMAGITGKIQNKIGKKNIVIMCADNGVVAEGVSVCPQNLTTIVTNNFTRGITGVCVLAKYAGAELTVIDIGINDTIENPKVINKKIAYGTQNMIQGPAMSREEAIKAIEVGIETVDQLVKNGVELFGTGEMGVGNTATSAAVLSVLSGMSPEIVVGKGSGLTEEQLKRKKDVVTKAITVNAPNKMDPIDVLAKVGGFDIAGLCGCFLGAAKNRVPIVIDGFIASAAALCAYRMEPYAREFMFPSHLSAEPGAKYMMEEIGLEPMLNLKMRLGEGSGCPLAFQVIEAALYTMEHMATFEEATIVNDFLIDIR